MKNAVIIPNLTKDVDFSVTKAVVSKLLSLGIVPYLDESISHIDGALTYSSIPDNADFIIVVGGDGSVIDAAHFAVELDIPIVGINLGRIGYLAAIEPDNLDLLDKISVGEYIVEKKMLLDVDGHFAVNDVVISHSDYLGVCDFGLSDSLGNNLCYRSDGIILSTPQGSTAYALSAGGPIVAHDVFSIAVTPICPHSFFNRSVVFNADDVLTITNNGDYQMNVSIDGRMHGKLLRAESINVSRSEKTLKMITFSKNSMFSELFRKMSNLEGL